MPPIRCRSAGCGRFVTAGADRCGHHPPATEAGPDPGRDAGRDPGLRPEIDALRLVLDRLVREMDDLESLARHVPRVASAAIQAARAQHQLGAREQADILAVLGAALDALDGPDAPTATGPIQPQSQPQPASQAQPRARPPMQTQNAPGGNDAPAGGVVDGPRAIRLRG